MNGQASVSFRQITPLRQNIYAGNQVRLTTADRSAGRLARGGPSDSLARAGPVLFPPVPRRFVGETPVKSTAPVAELVAKLQKLPSLRDTDP